MTKDKDKIVDLLAGIVNRSGITDEPEKLSGYQSAGFIRGVPPVASVKPSSAGDVRSLINLAKEEGMNLIFTSSAPPRFRGDTVPTGDAVIVDMSGLDKIARVDRRNKVALIEPGVTFDNLIGEADKAGLKVLMPLLPRSGKSVLTSYLEREPILIPKYHWDMTDPMLCTELIFGTGDLFRTGSAGSPGTIEQQWAADNFQKNPLGPGQTDFLRIVQGSQGTMAAVTWSTIKLEVKPQIHRMYFVSEPELGKLFDFSYTVLKRKLCDEFFFVNRAALSTLTSPETGTFKHSASEHDRYILVYGVSGYDCLPEDRINFVEHDLAELAGNCGVKPTDRLGSLTATQMDSMLKSSSKDPYYKNGPKGAFADIFFLTTLDKTPLFIDVMERVAGKHGYPKEQLGIYIQPIQHGRTVHLEFTIYYDDSNEGERTKTEKLFSDASEALFKAGAFFSRPYGDWARLAYSACPDTVEALNKVKQMLDPNGVLNSGRLCFKEAE